MAESMNVHEAKTHLSRLLERVQAGERIVISKAGKPVADLIPHQATPVVFGGLKGQLAYDDETLDGPDADIEAMFYGPDGSDDAAS